MSGGARARGPGIALAWLACAGCAAPEPAPVPPPIPVAEPVAAPEPQPAPREPAPLEPVAAPGVRREAGAWLRAWQLALVPDRSTDLWPGQRPNLARAVEGFEFDPSSGELGRLAPGAWCTLEADLEVSTAGTYAFRLTGAGDSDLYVDGVRADLRRGGEIALEEGVRALAIECRLGLERAALALEWRPPGNLGFERIPSAFVSHVSSDEVATAPGPKRVHRSRARVRPGDGAPLASPPPEVAVARGIASFPGARVTALSARGEEVLVALDDGSVRSIAVAARDRPATERTVAAGLDAPCGMAVLGARLLVAQASELTEVADLDLDGSADEYRCALAWRDVGGSDLQPRALTPLGSVAFALLDDPRDGGTLALEIAPDSRGAVVLARHALPPGRLALAAGREVLLGDAGWSDGSGPRLSVVEGPRLSTVARFPYAAANGTAIPLGQSAAGAFAGQWLVGGVVPGSIERVFLERVEGRTQGCAFRYAGGAMHTIDAGAIDGSGALWLAGEDAARRSAALQVWSPIGGAPFDLRAVRVLSDGFEVELTSPLAHGHGAEPAGWRVESQDLSARAPPEELRVVAARVDAERLRVRLEVEGLREHSLVHVRAVAPPRSEAGEELWTAEAWYALERIPSAATDDVHPPAVGAPEIVPPARDGWETPFVGEARTSDGEWGDFELELEWRARPGGVGALLYRVGPDGAGPAYCLVDPACRAALDPLRAPGAFRDVEPPSVAAAAPSGAWQRSRIVVRGSRAEHWLNGARVAELDLGGEDWRRKARERGLGTEVRARGRVAIEAPDPRIEIRAVWIRALR